ncbi:Anaphase-promoting complex subunit 1 [Gaertneriomyces sp. JEL0708]|nr:Anaphase-promoting complex subunit 1 [Gaertneriomyces sp. JEL0708]
MEAVVLGAFEPYVPSQAEVGKDDLYGTLIAEILGQDLPKEQARSTLLCHRQNDLQDQGHHASGDVELTISGSSVFISDLSCRKSPKCYKHDQTVLHALYAYFEVDPLLASHPSTSQDRETENVQRCLVVIFEKAGKLYFDDGRVFDVPVPYNVKGIWPLDRGILLQRYPDEVENSGTSPILTLTHPLAPYKPLDVHLDVPIFEPVTPSPFTAPPPVVPPANDGLSCHEILLIDSSANYIVSFDGTHHLWKYAWTDPQVDKSFTDCMQDLDIGATEYVKKRLMRGQVTIERVWSGDVGTGAASSSAFVAHDHWRRPTVWMLSPPSSKTHVRVLTPLHSSTASNGALSLTLGEPLEVLSAVSVEATRENLKDVLILKTDYHIALWTGWGAEECNLLSVELAPRFGTYIQEEDGKRKKRPIDDMDIDVDGIAIGDAHNEVMRQARVVMLSDPCQSRVCVHLSTGRILRISLDAAPHSELVSRCFDALICALPVDMYTLFLHRHTSLAYGPESKWNDLRGDEWEDFCTTLLSFCHGLNSTDDTVLLPGNSSLDIEMNRDADIRNGGTALCVPDKPSNLPDSYQMLITCFRKSKALLWRFHADPNLLEALPRLLLYLHFVYEEFGTNTLWHGFQQLVGALCHTLSARLGWNAWTEGYQRDGIVEVPLWATPCASESPALEQLHFRYLLLTSLRHRLPIPNMNSFLPESATPQSILVQSSFLHRIATVMNIFLRRDSSIAEVVREFVRLGFDKDDLEIFPVGIAAIVQSIIAEASIDPTVFHDEGNDRIWKLVGREDMMLQYSLNAPTISAIIEATQTAVKQEDGTEYVHTVISKARFSKDKRLEEVRRLLQSTHPAPLPPDLSIPEDGDFQAEQQRVLLTLASRVWALPMGRGCLTLGCWFPDLTGSIFVPPVSVCAKLPPQFNKVELDTSPLPPGVTDWPQFHNGVAAGLTVVPTSSRTGADPKSTVTGEWIAYNTPLAAMDNGYHMPHATAGLILGLGLTGNLRNVNLYDIVEWMNMKRYHVGGAVLLGLAATYCGESDARHTRLVYSHIETTEPTHSGFGARHVTGVEGLRPTAIVSLGVLYMGTLARLHIERVLEVIEDPGVDGALALACGLSLGMIVLGKMNTVRAASLADLDMTTRLLRLATATHTKDNRTVTTDVQEASTIALGMMYMKTRDQNVSHALRIPMNKRELEDLRLDSLRLRVFVRGLIMWEDQKPPTKEWVERHVPTWIQQKREKYGEGDSGDRDDSFIEQAYWACVSGALWSIGVTFAGTGNQAASEVIEEYLHQCLAGISVPLTTFAQKMLHHTLESILALLMVCLSMVLSGRGTITTLRLLRRLSLRPPSSTYMHHFATSLSLGFLFLGGGTFTLDTSNRGIAGLVCASWPRFPKSTVSENLNSHTKGDAMQGWWRWLWVLAARPGCLVTIEGESRSVCSVPVRVRCRYGQVISDVTPCLIPNLHEIQVVETLGERYWCNRMYAHGGEECKASAALERGVMVVKRREGYLSYEQDPAGQYQGRASEMVSSSARSRHNLMRTLLAAGAVSNSRGHEPSSRCDLLLWLRELSHRLASLTPRDVWDFKLVAELELAVPSLCTSQKDLHRLVHQVEVEIETFFVRLEADTEFRKLLSATTTKVNQSDALHIPTKMKTLVAAYQAWRESPGLEAETWIKDSYVMTKNSSDSRAAEVATEVCIWMEMMGRGRAHEVNPTSIRRVMLCAGV